MHFTHRCEPKISFDRNVGKSLGYTRFLESWSKLKSLKTQVAREHSSLKKVSEILVKFPTVLVWNIFFSVKPFR